MRVLLVGGGCRGLALTRSLAADGHAVRVVTRHEERRAEIEIAQMLDRVNEKRAEKGQPLQTIEQLKAELGL